ncbi:MAG: winged helix-turn-helix transcriptional regulator [Actinophytocola sp.]
MAAGVLRRKQYTDWPPRHKYVLTESSRALRPALMALMGNNHATKGNPPTVWEHDCGAEFRPAMVRGLRHLGRRDQPPRDPGGPDPLTPNHQLSGPEPRTRGF